MYTCAREVLRFSGATLAILVLLLPAAAQTPPAPLVWVAAHKNLTGIDAAENRVAVTASLANETESLAVDPRSGTVWVLSHKHLQKLDATGNPLAEVDLRALDARFDEGESLALDPYDGSVWIAGKKRLLSVTEAGTRRASWLSPETIEGIALDIDETLWLMTKKRLLRLSRDAKVLAETDLATYSHNPRFLAVDGLGGVLWLIDEKQLLRFDSNHPEQTPLAIALPEDQRDIRAVVSHPVFGTLWLGAKDQLLIHDRNGTLLRQVDLSPYALGELQALVFEPATLSLWVAGKRAIGRFTGNGELIMAIAGPKETESAAAGPFVLLPTLSLLAPPDNALTRDPAPRLEYELGAECSGTPCVLVDSYLRSLHLDVALNGQVIGPFSLSGSRALYDPSGRLPEGLNVVKAQASDAFGHKSNPVESRFTIDTVPPKFLSVSPPDGSTLTQSAVTISGSVDDPTASVTLADASGSGIAMGGANFRFAVLLRNGLNTFTLTARDPAGNETSMPLRLTLSAVTVRIESPAAGTSLASGHIVVSGTYQGPPNTGVTVNGRIATTAGNRFWANLSLPPGPSTLTAVATSPAGLTAEHVVSVTVDRADPEPLQVTLEPESGIAPMNAKVVASYAGAAPLSRITVDFDGDGSIDATTTDPTVPLEFTFDTAGVYYARVTAVDQLNSAYPRTLAVVVSDGAQMDQLFASLWNGMNDALKRRDLDDAVSYLNESARRKYRPVFEALLPHFPQIIASYSPLQRVSVSSDISEYAVNRTVNGQYKIFLIYFLRDVDGVWRLEAM